jgi:hypothetical protein
MSKKETPIKQNKNFFTILLVLVLVLFVLFFFYFKPKEQTNKVSIKNTPITSPISIGDWKTYSNKGYSFSIRYPKDFKLEIGNGSEDDLPPSKYTGLIPSYILLSKNDVEISINPEGYYGTQYIYQKSEAEYGYIDGKKVSIYSETDKFNNRMHNLYNFSELNKAPNFSIVTEFHKNNSDLVHQIISTLKFIN